MVRRFTEWEAMEGESKAFYAVAQQIMLEPATDQLIWNLRVFVQHWSEYEVKLEQDAGMTHLEEDPSTREILYMGVSTEQDFWNTSAMS